MSVYSYNLYGIVMNSLVKKYQIKMVRIGKEIKDFHLI